ncbi:uncharacterized protein LOC136749347 [Amia ocellicauda]|uniref:uncharacterized protein LOC136749347 n=1 Tax=Amia ocellicauda TaxID=2972642 RepID=UPI003463DE80
MAFCLRLGVALIMLLSEVRMQSPGTMNTTCLGNLMIMDVDSSLTWGNHFIFNVMDPTGKFIPLTPALATQCGYSISVDHWGNVKFIASVLSCFAENNDDEYFSLTVQLQISPNVDMSSSTKYTWNMGCDYFPWPAREILCERNYMEVSVRRGVPLIEPNFVQDAPEDWSLAFPEATTAENDIWQIVFHLPKEKAMTVHQAMSEGYGVNTTYSRIVLRTPYNTSESQSQLIQGVPLSVVRSTTFYKQRWMILMVDTAVACPIDGTTFTEEMITWAVPQIITPLVPTLPISNVDVQLGVNNEILLPSTIIARNYNLTVGPNVVIVQFPVGATGGYYKSHVIPDSAHGIYGITYTIDPFLVYSWEDDTYDKTKYTLLHPITTPFMPRPPHVNYTVPDNQRFNVTLGTFLPDVELVQITFVTGTLTIPYMVNLWHNVQEHIFPNGSKAYNLQVPLVDPNVVVEVTSPTTRRYTLPLLYQLVVLPENDTFTHPAQPEITLQDIVPPTVTGYCDLANFYVNATNGNLGKNWLLVVGTRTLTPAMETEYTYQETATSVLMTVPYNSPDVVYELVSSSEIRSRLDLALKDSAKLWIYTNFSISCSFPLKMIECYTNGTMTALAVKVESVPSLNPSQLTLRDPSCKPSLSTDGTAFFHFNVNTCQTTRKFASNIMTYENEVQWTSPTITYRFAIACHYYINDTEVVSLEPMDNPAPVVEPVLGMITVVIKLALDVSYNSFYGSSDYPVVKYLQEPLYFEVELLNRQDPQVELFLENCWATASTDRDRSPQWDIIIDSCENTEDLYKTIFHPVTANQRVLFPSHLKRFEVKMFTFTNEQTVLETPIYVHCGVVICDANQPSDGVCRGQCIPGKQRFGRSADRKNRVVVSSGPIDVGAGSHS